MILREDVDVVHDRVREVLTQQLGSRLLRQVGVPAELARVHRGAFSSLKVVVGTCLSCLSPRELLFRHLGDVGRATALIPDRVGAASHLSRLYGGQGLVTGIFGNLAVATKSTGAKGNPVVRLGILSAPLLAKCWGLLVLSINLDGLGHQPVLRSVQVPAL